MTSNGSKPCPFCANNKDHAVNSLSTLSEQGIDRKVWFVVCGNPECGAEGPYRLSYRDAIAAWNQRIIRIESIKT